MAATEYDSVRETGAHAPTAALIHLSGPRRGKTQRLAGSTFRIDPLDSTSAVIRPADQSGGVARLGSLHRAGDSYELTMEADGSAWVNGAPARTRLLAPGDLVEIENGPVFRFRLYPRGKAVHKTVKQVFADCVDCAHQDQRPLLVKGPSLAAEMLRDLATQTTLWFRGGVLVALALLAITIVYQVRQVHELETNLTREQARVQAMADLLSRGERDKLTREDLAAVRAEIQQGLGQTHERVAALEARSAAVTRVIADTSASVLFIQGAYGFVHAETGRPLRLVPGLGGEPLRMPNGEAVMTLEGDGPPVETNYTGTAFIINEAGLLLTNRHVALPWESSDVAEAAKALGLKPVMRRMLGFLAGEREPFEVRFVGASDSADLALLSCQEATRLRRPLKLAGAPPSPGDEVIVLGYPTGIRALLARAGDRFVAELAKRPDIDFWGVARELARAGLVTPLASRGIVGQATGEAIVYDAETTSGGSGGPVLNLSGEVVAVNTAIIPEFGGSNLGVPIAYARKLLEQQSARK